MQYTLHPPKLQRPCSSSMASLVKAHLISSAPLTILARVAVTAASTTMIFLHIFFAFFTFYLSVMVTFFTVFLSQI